jgi:hypothetical protein
LILFLGRSGFRLVNGLTVKVESDDASNKSGHKDHCTHPTERRASPCAKGPRC